MRLLIVLFPPREEDKRGIPTWQSHVFPQIDIYIFFANWTNSASSLLKNTTTRYTSSSLRMYNNRGLFSSAEKGTNNIILQAVI